MILVKCKCGCHFTVSDETFLKRSNLACMNCSNGVKFTQNTRLDTLADDLKDSGMDIYRLPDDAEIKITLK
jgi:hypothetical protein